MAFCNNFNNKNRNYYEFNHKKRRDHFYNAECQKSNNQSGKFYSYADKNFECSPYKKMHFAYSEVNGILGGNFNNNNSNRNMQYSKYSRSPYNNRDWAKRTEMNYSIASDLINKARKNYAYEPEYNYDTNYYGDYDYKSRSKRRNNEDKYGLNSFFNPEDDRNIFRSRDERNERRDLEKRIKSKYEEDYYDNDDDFENERNKRRDLKKRVKSKYEEDYYDDDDFENERNERRDLKKRVKSKYEEDYYDDDDDFENERNERRDLKKRVKSKYEEDYYDDDDDDFENERNERRDLKKRVKSKYEEDYYDDDDYLNSHENINFLKKKRGLKRF